MYLRIDDEVRESTVTIIYDNGELTFEINGCVGAAGLSPMEGALVLRCLRGLVEELIGRLPGEVQDFWAEVHRDQDYHERMAIYQSVGFEETRPGSVWATVESVLDAIQS